MPPSDLPSARKLYGNLHVIEGFEGLWLPWRNAEAAPESHREYCVHANAHGLPRTFVRAFDVEKTFARVMGRSYLDFHDLILCDSCGEPSPSVVETPGGSVLCTSCRRRIES